MWSDKRQNWLALNMVQGLGNVAFRNLLKKFGNPEDIFKADIAELHSIEGLRKEAAHDLIARRFTGDPVKELKDAEAHGVRIITYHDKAYPEALKKIHASPMVLYIRGHDIPNNLTLVALVGSRNATHYGLKTAEKLAHDLARRGLGVVSGMAKGIDSSAHWGCLRGEGFTVAVLGTGLDVTYPASNRRLFDEISQKGTIISEFPLGTPPNSVNFPIRNRLISGLSKGVVIVEATKKSGSLITASLALEQGKDVFAVPGSIDSSKSMGCHLLIKQGAGLIENVDDILDGIGITSRVFSEKEMPGDKDLTSMNDSERNLFEIIGNYPMHIDQIAQQANLEPGEVSSTLLRMELKGLIKQLPGMMFVH